jgi:integrase
MAAVKFEKTKHQGVVFRNSTRRRQNGRPEPCFYIYYRVGEKVKWEKIGWASEGFTAAMASQIRAERLGAVQAAKLGLAPPAPPEPAVTAPTFGAAFNTAWERSFKRLTMAGVYVGFFRNHLNHLADKPIDAIRPSDIEAVRDGLAAKGRSPQTIKHVIGLAGRTYKLMAKWGIYEGRSPVEGVELSRQDNRRERYLTREEAGRLLDEIKGRSEYAWRVAMTSLHTGMRRGEVAGLLWEHVNLGAGTIAVVDTKSGRNRTVYVSKPLAAMLAGLDGSGGGRVFIPPMGGKGDGQGVRNVFARAVMDLGLNDGIGDRRNRVVFHTLRHTFASWLVSAGQPLYTVATLLGHSTLEMTRRYAHLAPEARRAAVDTLETYLNPAGKPSSPGPR